MTENTENTEKIEESLTKEDKKQKRKGYARLLAIVMILTVMLDSYSTGLQGGLQSVIVAEFLGPPSVLRNSYVAIGSGIYSFGLWIVFFFQYSADTLGRKKLLLITVSGMGVALIGIALSANYIMYVIFMLLLLFFFNSDIWMIYIGESVKARKRAKYTYLVLFIGVFGALLMSINRMIFVVTLGVWRGMTFFPIIISLVLSIVIILKLKETPRFQQIQNYRAKKGKTSFKQNISAVFKIEERKSYVTMLVISFIFGMSTIVLLTFIPIHIIDSGFTEAQFTGLQLVAILSLIIAFGGNSFLLDKVGRKPMMVFYMILLAIASIAFVIFVEGSGGQASALPGVAILMLLTNVSFYALNTQLSLYTLEFLPTQSRGAGMGLRRLVFAIGGTVGLFLSAPLILAISLGPAMILFLCFTFITIPLGLLRVKETKDVDLAEIK